MYMECICPVYGTHMECVEVVCFESFFVAHITSLLMFQGGLQRANEEWCYHQ